jgi:hypothetical protein
VILFTNIHIFDGSGAAPFIGEVSIKGNRIDARGPAAIRDFVKSRAESGAKVVKFLLSGEILPRTSPFCRTRKNLTVTMKDEQLYKAPPAAHR